MKYLALPRGINVGGNNIIKKDELKACFEKAGCSSVLTYIQSGNILFCSDETDREKIAKKAQTELYKKLNNKIQTVIYKEEEYQILSRQHDSWGKEPEKKHNALFLLTDMSPEEAQQKFPKINPQYEEISFAKGVVFWSGSKEHYTKTSYVKNLIKSPLYKQVTIRNSNTSIKLKEMFNKI